VIAAPAATASYVYGVVGAGAADAVEERVQGTQSVGGGEVRAVRAGALAALTSEVSLAEFGADVLPAHLNDREWLEEHARTHEEVLEVALAVTSVVPFRFGTIYHDTADVVRMLDERRGELELALERIDGLVEVGVKAYVDQTALEDALRRREGAPADAEAGGAGRAYMLRRQLDRRIAARADEVGAQAAADAHERLTASAVDARVNRPQPPELSGRSDRMLLNGAYLVERADERLAAQVRELSETYRDLRITFELTGPWPPYNFVGGDEPA
jgi:hypothetical protein